MAQRILTIEIGSTMTKANGFVVEGEKLVHKAQAFSLTTIAQGDVSLGVDDALRTLEEKFRFKSSAAEAFINSSAAGGLKMTVHGLTPSMTARAAKEASLGAGAIVKKLTAGELSTDDLEDIAEIKPNLILLAGGVDFGEREIVLRNAKKLIELRLPVPIIYAGNTALQREIKKLAEAKQVEIWIAENVFPGVDQLNVVPLRRLIHEAFSKHIIHAPGMQKLAQYSSQPVLPTPGAVLLATELFAAVCGDTIAIDVGGATTDVHSVTEGNSENALLLVEPEPREKRTVEGDLGVFVNAESVLKLDESGLWGERKESLRAIPKMEDEIRLTEWLTHKAAREALLRHAGQILDLYSPTGKKKIIKGKDLSAVQNVIGTGGALTKIPGGEKILRDILVTSPNHLLPPQNVRIIMDRNYILSSLGTFLKFHRELAKNSIEELVCTLPV